MHKKYRRQDRDPGWLEAVYCCLTTLFTTMFTVYYCGVFIEKYVCTKFHLNWLLCQ